MHAKLPNYQGNRKRFKSIKLLTGYELRTTSYVKGIHSQISKNFVKVLFDLYSNPNGPCTSVGVSVCAGAGVGVGVSTKIYANSFDLVSPIQLRS